MTHHFVRAATIFLLIAWMATKWISVSFADEKPNILLLLSDDHSYPFLSCYGNTNVHTPTIDRLAKLTEVTTYQVVSSSMFFFFLMRNI